MNNDNVKRELAILLAHFIKNKQPAVYEKLVTFCDKNKLYPPSCTSVEDALDLRYKNFPPNQFYNFIKSLLPKDDYPSIFRRIQPFRTPIPTLPFKTINPIKRIFGHYEAIYCLAMDPLGRILATGADDNKIRLWTLPDLDPICTFSGHENCITNVCFNPLCTYLLSSSHDKTIRLWSLVDGSCAATLVDFTSNLVHSAVFSPSGSMIAAACEDGTIPLWVTCDALQGSSPCRVITTVGKGPAAWVAFSPGGEFLSYTCEQSAVVVIALKTMTIFQLELHTSLVGLTTFTSSYFVSGSPSEFAPHLITASNEEGVACVWEMENFNYKPKYIFKQTGAARRPTKIHQLSLDADEHLLVLAKSNGVFVCDTYTGETYGKLPDCAAFDDCTCIAPNPVYREVFFFGNSSGFVAIADVRRNEILTEMKCAEDTGFLDAAWSKDGRWIFASDSLGSISTFCTFGPNDSLRKSSPDFFVGEFFEDEKNPHSGIFVDREGNKLKKEKQPRKHDIRNMDLRLMALQAPALKNCAIELNLIQKMTAPDRQAISTSTSSTIGPPPLHVHISIEYPVNPKGGSIVSENESETTDYNDSTTDTETDNENQKENENEEDENDGDTNLSLRRKKKTKRRRRIIGHIDSDADDYMFIDNDQYQNDFINHKTIVNNNNDDEFEIEENKSIILSDDVPRGFWPDHVCTIACDDNIFIPQVGDEVVLIWSAYMKYLSSAEEDENENEKDNHKSIKKPDKLTEITRCIIQQLTSYEDEMELKMSSPNLTSWITIHFPIPEEVTFLIPLNKFKFAKKIGKSLNLNDKVIVPFVSEDGGLTPYTGNITEISAKWKNAPFESIKVDWGNGDITNISPWEIISLNDTEIKYVDTSICVEGIENGMIAAVDSLLALNKYALFRSVPNPNDFADYEKIVSCPMSLSFLRERLESGYYRSTEAIHFDIQLIHSNALLYNDPASDVVALAKEIQDSLKSSLNALAKQYRDRRQVKSK